MQLCFILFYFFLATLGSLLFWYNEAICANEAEDLLTANSLISHPALFEEPCCGASNRG